MFKLVKKKKEYSSQNLVPWTPIKSQGISNEYSHGVILLKGFAQQQLVQDYPD